VGRVGRAPSPASRQRRQKNETQLVKNRIGNCTRGCYRNNRWSAVRSLGLLVGNGNRLWHCLGRSDGTRDVCSVRPAGIRRKEVVWRRMCVVRRSKNRNESWDRIDRAGLRACVKEGASGIGGDPTLVAGSDAGSDSVNVEFQLSRGGERKLSPGGTGTGKPEACQRIWSLK